jgi:hypothetical protein
MPTKREQKIISTRQSARQALGRLIRQAREEVESLEALEKAITWDKLRSQDEEALWRFFASCN